MSDTRLSRHLSQSSQSVWNDGVWVTCWTAPPRPTGLLATLAVGARLAAAQDICPLPDLGRGRQVGVPDTSQMPFTGTQPISQTRDSQPSRLHYRSERTEVHVDGHVAVLASGPGHWAEHPSGYETHVDTERASSFHGLLSSDGPPVTSPWGSRSW